MSKIIWLTNQSIGLSHWLILLWVLLKLYNVEVFFYYNFAYLHKILYSKCWADSFPNILSVLESYQTLKQTKTCLKNLVLSIPIFTETLRTINFTFQSIWILWIWFKQHKSRPWDQIQCETRQSCWQWSFCCLFRKVYRVKFS